MRRTQSNGVDYTGVYRSNYTWEDHIYRLNVTAGLAARFDPRTIIDPAAGDGSIANVLQTMIDAGKVYDGELSHVCAGDISQANTDAMKHLHPDWYVFQGDLFQMMDEDTDEHDMIILTEILEHLPDPRKAVKKAAACAKVLIASSPIVLQGHNDPNEEHLWQFDTSEYERLLSRNGWNPLALIELSFTNPNYYKFQMWAAERK